LRQSGNASSVVKNAPAKAVIKKLKGKVID
jgi:hypothetical protein